ncbi:heme NO-binding domain-containing protein [Ruegeria pomeroyi]|uniref:Heme NO-binding domain-containing protein n=1 Tax=Ruegeria alba TaxID=2916756 RepID=A0ABS9NUL6_9RHOB|nr:heme NO-binding domain-containing protein [Ruegeria alba]MCE8512679.1 heme NO-binding domain-containing protein [Ruegeria pomeroyi]MCE8521376.1 heme NO-binding domain-containing protein [Ruegeria pomeroyi]MCE8531291.1 heme NO-binding domain-containing protein [Ruegeria pomeroyi]MCE8534140.1 heme NO-binding domain-containing protein [Ruegeria pomeroyi]MCG6557706.1 heme NO-binding domain-containing protein [Ruegeria alba]
MHGLINRAIQSFVCNTYGQSRWIRITEAAHLGFIEFEAMLVYDDETSLRVLQELCLELGRPQREVLEDLGTYLVSNPNTEALRRLLRFGGVTYLEFLHSLDDLPDRARLAVSDLHLPALELREESGGRFSLTCHTGLPGYANVMMGVLRAMADDYGALVMLEHSGTRGKAEVIEITLIETAFAEGRSFELGARAG